MELLIKIPDEDYKFIKDLQSLIIGGRGSCKIIQQNVINAIKNGTPYNPTGDCISRSVLDEIRQLYKKYQPNLATEVIEFGNALEELIDNAQAVEYTFEQAFQKTVCENRLYCPARPKGEWVLLETNCDDGGNNRYECSECHYSDVHASSAEVPFCWHCGANMRDEKKRGEEISKLRLMTVEECAGHTIDYAMGWKACIEWIKKGGAE